MRSLNFSINLIPKAQQKKLTEIHIIQNSAIRIVYCYICGWFTSYLADISKMKKKVFNLIFKESSMEFSSLYLQNLSDGFDCTCD